MPAGELGSAGLTRRIAGLGLGGDGPAIVVPEAGWRGFLDRVKAERLSGLAMAGMRDGRLLVPDGRAPELRDAHRSAMLQSLALERVLVRVAGAFRGEGIEAVVLKGPTLAALYPDPSWRPFGDLDLMVRGEDWQRSCAVLAGMGFGRVLPEPRSHFDVRFGKAATHRAEDGLEVDLHRTLVVGPFGLWMDPDELHRRSVPFRLGGVALRRLDDTAQLVHACVHAALGWRPPLLLSLRDVVQVLDRATVDWELFGDVVRRWKLDVVVRHAFSAVVETLGASLRTEATPFLSATPGRRELRALRAYTSPRRARGGLAVATLRAVPGARGKMAYLRALVMPERSFLAARGRGRTSYLRRWVVPLRWLLERPPAAADGSGPPAEPDARTKDNEASRDREGMTPTGASRDGRSDP